MPPNISEYCAQGKKICFSPFLRKNKPDSADSTVGRAVRDSTLPVEKLSDTRSTRKWVASGGGFIV